MDLVAKTKNGNEYSIPINQNNDLVRETINKDSHPHPIILIGIIIIILILIYYIY